MCVCSGANEASWSCSFGGQMETWNPPEEQTQTVGAERSLVATLLRPFLLKPWMESSSTLRPVLAAGGGGAAGGAAMGAGVGAAAGGAAIGAGALTAGEAAPLHTPPRGKMRVS